MGGVYRPQPQSIIILPSIADAFGKLIPLIKVVRIKQSRGYER